MILIIKRDGRYLKDLKAQEWTDQQAEAETFRLRQNAERAAAMAGGGELCTVSPSATQAHNHRGVRYEPPQARPRAAAPSLTSSAAAIATGPVHVSASPLLALVSRHVEAMPPRDLETLATLGDQARAQLERLESARVGGTEDRPADRAVDEDEDAAADPLGALPGPFSPSSAVSSEH